MSQKIDDKKTKSDKREIYQKSQRCLVASLLYDASNAKRIFELVGVQDFDDVFLAKIIESIIDLSRRDEKISVITVATELENKGVLAEIGGIQELYKLYTEGEKYLLEAPAEKYADNVKESSAKNKLNNIVLEAKDFFKDDSGVSAIEGISRVQSSFSDELYRLSDDATVVEVKDYVNDYFDVLTTRKEINEENAEKADGLQGIPSLIPSLNKYTSGWMPGQMITVGARTGVGKALDIQTPIPTPSGWKTMGELKIGDSILGQNGVPTQVIETTPIQYKRDCYRITFHNGKTIIADKDHRWVTETKDERRKNKKGQVRTTQDIIDTLYTDNDDINHYIKSSQPLLLPEKDLLIDPYLFGWFISSKNKNDDGSFTFYGDEYSIEDYYLFKLLDEKNYQYHITSNNNNYSFNVFFDDDYFSFFDGRIPISFLRGSVNQRQRLLQGMIDFKGIVIGNGKDTVLNFLDESLADDVAELISSLGYIVYQDKYFSFDEKRHNKVIHVVSYNFSESYFSIVSVDRVDSVPVRCIQVDNDDHMYLAGDFIPTHNTIFAIMSIVAAARAGKSVLFFSLEMSHEDIIDRIIACMSGVSITKLRNGTITDFEKDLVGKASDELKDMKITIDTNPGTTIDAIRSKAFRKAQGSDGLDMVIIDYLQLVPYVGSLRDRQQQVSEISRNIKLTAKSLEVPLMVLVQLNRAKDDEDDDKMPVLDNIRESGAIAMDSDVVILLHRSSSLDDVTPPTVVILDKNRNGESHKRIMCHSNLECSLFREMRRENDVSDVLSEEESRELTNDNEIIDDSVDEETIDAIINDDNIYDDDYDF